ncbi:MAG: galactose-1-epimerase [Prevotella sp.]|nr:galactose-1-epimerase [Prevotella sp.]
MRYLSLTIALWLATLGASAGDGDVQQAMRRATQYMMDVASYNGGFVWNYLPDYSRQWGELEAPRTMVWLQSPSTPDVGQVLLDAYHATNDEYYYECAQCVALCIMQGQLPCGGWNYMFDLEPEDSLKTWYETIGKQAWRLEEFQHYYGNATFDDKVTKHCAEFLLRIYLEKHDKTFLAPLEKAIDFFVKSQYPNGGWPQRYPLMSDFKEKADYTSYVTLNDGVMEENIDFLLQCYTSLGREDLKQPILKAMHLLRDLQQKSPLAGWADQYTPDDLLPASARSYEARAVNTATTFAMANKMMEFYSLTGDPSFLNGIPDAIRFLESQQLPEDVVKKVMRYQMMDGMVMMPRFVNPDNGRPLYVHRKGSNTGNGAYFTDENPEATIAHYNSFAIVDISRLKAALEREKKKVRKDLERNSPLLQAKTAGPKTCYFDLREESIRRGIPMASVSDIVAFPDEEGRWLSPLRQVSNPYKPLPKDMAPSEDMTYAQTMVGDEYDTSPYENREVKGISTRTYIQNMATLIASLKPMSVTLSGLDPERFVSTVEGKPTALYVLSNKRIEACITNYGARVVSLMIPDKNGELQDVVLGFDNIDDYHLFKQNFGSVVGRYAGRIKDAHYTLDGKEVELQRTGANISHGGYPGFADKVWEMVEHNDSTLKLKLVSPDGENGFPGTLEVVVTYQLTYDDALVVEYEAVTDQPTVVNLANHTFFNISGTPTSQVLSQMLKVDAKYIATYDKNKNLDGNFMKVKNTPFDFTSSKAIGTDIDLFDEQMGITKGYDHSFVLRHPGNLNKPAAVLYDEQSGRSMSVFTTEPAIHVYTANGLDGSLVGKNGVEYQKQSAVCLETMHLADSPNHPVFPSTVLRPGETYKSKTIFMFSDQTHKKRNLVSSILMYGTAASLTGLGIVGVVSLAK